MHFGEDYLSNRCHHWQNHAGAWPNKNSFLSKIAWLPLRRLWNTREGYEDRQSNPLRKTSRNVASINNYFKSTVAKVKKQYDLKDASITNGPQGTISQKTQCSLGILTQGLDRLVDNLKNLNVSYTDNINLETLLTTIVENLHAVSHFKDETFSVLQYALDFGTIVKESMQRWSAKYYTHEKSYYPVPQSSPLSAVSIMTPLLKTISKASEEAMREWAEKYRPVRQRTLRSETTKDKAGALSPAVYLKATKCISKSYYNEEPEEVNGGIRNEKESDLRDDS